MRIKLQAAMIAGLLLGGGFITNIFAADAEMPARLPATVKPAVTPRVEYFDLADVRLTDGTFKEAVETDQAYLQPNCSALIGAAITAMGNSMCWSTGRSSAAKH